MEWTECLRKSITYMEQHLLEEIDGKMISDAVNVSPFYFRKGFKVMTGMTITEYIRNRRLYLAALELVMGKTKIIDLSYKYGYDSPESFSKAFSRFHGLSPRQLNGDSRRIKVFLPLKISISILGGSVMDYSVEKMEAFKVIGFEHRIKYDSAYGAIPEFWNSFSSDFRNGKNRKAVQEMIESCMIGEYAVCISDKSDSSGFRYLIAGRYQGNEVPEGLTVCEIPQMQWAKFSCTGPLPGALQSVNTQIYKEWLPGNTEYEIVSGINIEWYSMGDNCSQDYYSEIWIPVKRQCDRETAE